MLPLCAQAQQIVDDSGSRIEEATKPKLFALMINYLKDPLSAQYSRLQNGKSGGVCGYVNAKNAYGGYAGRTLFFADFDKSSVHFLPDVDRLSIDDLEDIDRAQKALDVLKASCSGG